MALRLACRTIQVGWAVAVGAASVELGAGLTASPLPNQRSQLRESGVYGHVRHPIYTALWSRRPRRKSVQVIDAKSLSWPAWLGSCTTRLA